MRVTEAFLGNVAASGQKKIVALGSAAGSNGLINPGLVDTRGVLKLKPGELPPEEFAALMPLIRSGKIQLITPEESVTAMIALIDGLTQAESGAFLNYDGKPLPW